MPTFQRVLVLPLLFLAGAALADGHGGPEGPAPGRIVVTGSAEVSVAPDRAAFTAEIGNSGRDADAVLDENARRARRTVEALRAAGIALERIETRGVRLNPEWSPPPRDAEDDWQPRIVGYHASNRIEVETADLERVGELVAIAVEAGANGVEGIRFRLEEAAPTREEAIRRATAAALGEARVMAEAAGVRPGAVLELRLDHATAPPRPMLMARMEMAAMDVRGGAVPVEPGEVSISAAVTVTLGLAP